MLLAVRARRYNRARCCLRTTKSASDCLAVVSELEHSLHFRAMFSPDHALSIYHGAYELGCIAQSLGVICVGSLVGSDRAGSTPHGSSTDALFINYLFDVRKKQLENHTPVVFS